MDGEYRFRSGVHFGDGINHQPEVGRLSKHVLFHFRTEKRRQFGGDESAGQRETK